MVDTLIPRYAVLRDHRHWEDIRTSGLEMAPDGSLTLTRVPGSADGQPVRLPPPYDVDPSGLAVGAYGDIYIADTENHQLVWLDGICQARTLVPGVDGAGDGPGSFNKPGGLVIAGDRLYVADTDNGRVQVLHLPGLEAQATWQNPPNRPTALAADSRGHIYVLDRDPARVMRFNAWGSPDAQYNAALASHAMSPFAMAVDAANILYISDHLTLSVLRFDVDGGALSPLAGPSAKFEPRALAAYGGLVYVHDGASAAIVVFDAASGVSLGVLPGYQGPVSAMVISEIGDLYIKPGADEQYIVLGAGNNFVASGVLEAGPLDAGIDRTWTRAAVDADCAGGSRAELRLLATDDAAQSPSTQDWADGRSLAGALDSLVAPVPVTGDPPRKSGRFLWLQLRLGSSHDRCSSPRVEQVRAEASVESYLGYLPGLYAESDAPRGWLKSFLELFRSELGDLELLVDDMERLCDPITAPDDALPWLAEWLAFRVPTAYRPEDLREVLPRLYRLYQRRGTPDGLRKFIQLYTGVKAHVEESFRGRGLWLLGQSSRLGFDTALAPCLPDGMVVPGPSPADPAYQGLIGHYVRVYDNPQIRQREDRRVDPGVNLDISYAAAFPGPPIVSAAKAATSLRGFRPGGSTSVTWTGQIRPRYSEVYAFHVIAIGSFGLWINGELVVGNCTDLVKSEMPGPPGVPEHCPDDVMTEYRGLITLTAGQWHTITVKFATQADGLTIQLGWSSRSQVREIVPPECLYAIQDDNIDIPPARQDDPSESQFIIGETAVGEHGPLAKENFGEPVFEPTAHRFCVLVPRVIEPATREAIIEVIEAEKPAHTDYHLCFVEPRMRVGFQARVGIDAYVAGPVEPIELDASRLGFDSALSGLEDTQSGLRVGRDIGGAIVG